MKYLLIIISFFIITACSSDQDKYELKSPCVAADTTDKTIDAPCQRRRLLLNNVS